MRFFVFSRWTFRGKRWFWHLKGGNNRIIASGQSSGFANRMDAVSVCRAIGKERILEVEIEHG